MTPKDYELTTGATRWVSTDRVRVRRTLDVLIGGMLDVIGVDRFELPVEYVGAVIAVFVKPANIIPACKWMETGFSEAETLVRDGAGTENIRAPKLFAMVTLLLSEAQEDIALARTLFEARTSYKQEEAMMKPKTKQKEVEYA